MSERTADLLADALRLPDEDRASLTEQLLASFDPRPGEADPVDDAEFLAELDRRAEELRTHPAAGLPWEHVKGLR
jgi:putative addiction module component (TIGR02574 family)